MLDEESKDYHQNYEYGIDVYDNGDGTHGLIATEFTTCYDSVQDRRYFYS